MTLGHFLARLGIDHLQFQAGHCGTQQRQATHIEFFVGVGHGQRLGDAVALEHHPVDRVGLEADMTPRERGTDGHLSHTERGEHAARLEPERRGGLAERIHG